MIISFNQRSVKEVQSTANKSQRSRRFEQYSCDATLLKELLYQELINSQATRLLINMLGNF